MFTELEERVVIKAVALPFPGQVILLTSEHSTDVHRKDVRITESKLLQGELRPNKKEITTSFLKQTKSDNQHMREAFMRNTYKTC